MNRTHQRSGGRATERAGALALLAFVAMLAPGCNYGFEGGGFPAHIQTIFIENFENRTPQFDVSDRLYNSLMEELPGQLGVRPAGREVADAVLRGTITRYDDVAQSYRAGDPNQPVPDVLSHEVQIGVSIQLIDIRENVIRWEHSGLVGRGTYDPDAENEQVGQLAAIENIIEQIIDGAQSQW